MEDQQSIEKQLSKRVNALAMISYRADFNTKLMVAYCIVLSKISYLIQLWGSCEGYLLHALQVQLNKAARQVTGLSRFTLLQRDLWIPVAGFLSNNKLYTILQPWCTRLS